MLQLGPILRRMLAHPLTRGRDVDDPRTTDLRRQIVNGKPFLRQIYQQWYRTLAADVPAGGGQVLELGSGAGFFREFVPDVITSEIFACRGIDLVLDGTKLPLGDVSLRAIVMTDVFHHIPDVAAFLREAARTVRAGGVVAMIEPWVSPWSKLVYTRLHHEPFEPQATAWTFPATGPLSGANGALPWIVFQRDRDRFEREFGQWKIETVAPMMPLRYLVSGGVSMRSLMPGWTTPAWRGIEGAISPLKHHTAMFAHLVLRRVESKD